MIIIIDSAGNSEDRASFIISQANDEKDVRYGKYGLY